MSTLREQIKRVPFLEDTIEGGAPLYPEDEDVDTTIDAILNVLIESMPSEYHLSGLEAFDRGRNSMLGEIIDILTNAKEHGNE